MAEIECAGAASFSMSGDTDMGQVANSSNLDEQSPISTRQRLEWLDIAKGVAIFLVIVGHTVSQGPLRQTIYTVHMPIFFILAGYTFRPKSWKVLLKSSSERLLLPYVVLGIVAITPAILTSHISKIDRLYAGVEAFIFPSAYPASQWMGWDMWWGGGVVPYVDIGSGGVGMAWFLWCLLLARLLMNVLFLYVLKIRSIVGQLAADIGFGIVFMIAGVAMAVFPHHLWIFDMDLAFVATGFMLIGHGIKIANLVQPKYFWLGIVAGIFWFIYRDSYHFEMAARIYENPAMAFPIAIAGTYALSVISLFVQELRTVPVLQYGERALAWCGRHSLEIYTMHGLDGRLLPIGEFSIGEMGRSIFRFMYDLLLVWLIRRIR